jgi:hypothetical protein
MQNRRRKGGSRTALRVDDPVLAIFLMPQAAAARLYRSAISISVSKAQPSEALVAHMFDVAHALNIDPPERLLDPAIAAQQSRAIVDLIGRRLTITADGRTATLQWRDAEVVADRQSIRLPFSSRLDSAPGVVAVEALLFPYDPNHQTFLNVYDLSGRSAAEIGSAKAEGQALTQAILDRGRTRFEYYAGTTQGAFAVIRRFVPAGVHHILIGPDHLLFLVGCVAARRIHPAARGHRHQRSRSRTASRCRSPRSTSHAASAIIEPAIASASSTSR